MSKKKRVHTPNSTVPPAVLPNNHKFNFNFINNYQKETWDIIEKNEIIFILGEAGTGKTQVATAYAAKSILDKKARKIVLSRPTITTESLGYLPGDTNDKIYPFLIPILDCLDECVGKDGQDRKRVNESIEFAPLAFMRGRTLSYTTAILDEAQNATYEQLKLFITRLGKRSRLIITGDPFQSDLKNSGLVEMVNRLKDIAGVAIIDLPEAAQVRNPLLTTILRRI